MTLYVLFSTVTILIKIWSSIFSTSSPLLITNLLCIQCIIFELNITFKLWISQSNMSTSCISPTLSFMKCIIPFTIALRKPQIPLIIFSKNTYCQKHKYFIRLIVIRVRRRGITLRTIIPLTTTPFTKVSIIEFRRVT